MSLVHPFVSKFVDLSNVKNALHKDISCRDFFHCLNNEYDYFILDFKMHFLNDIDNKEEFKKENVDFINNEISYILSIRPFHFVTIGQFLHERNVSFETFFFLNPDNEDNLNRIHVFFDKPYSYLFKEYSDIHVSELHIDFLYHISARLLSDLRNFISGLQTDGRKSTYFDIVKDERNYEIVNKIQLTNEVSAQNSDISDVNNIANNTNFTTRKIKANAAPCFFEFMASAKHTVKRLNILYRSLVELGFVDSNVEKSTFRDIFKKKTKEKIIWGGNISDLKYFINKLYAENSILKPDPDKKRYEIAMNVFVIKGDSNFTIARLKDQSMPKRTYENIDSAIKVLYI